MTGIRKITQTALSILVAAGGLPAVSLADTTLRYDSGRKDFVVKIRPGEIRIDDGSDRWQLYRQADASIYSVHPASRSYTRMDQRAAEAIKSEMNELRQNMEKQLARLPAEQRRAARAALANQVPGMSEEAQNVSLDRSGGSQSVAGVACEPVQVVRDGRPGERLCVASAEALGMSEAEFESVSGMFSLMQTMLSGTGLEYVGLPYLDFDGMPIRYSQPDGGARSLSEVSHEAISDLSFEIPPGYSKRSPGLPQ